MIEKHDLRALQSTCHRHPNADCDPVRCGSGLLRRSLAFAASERKRGLQICFLNGSDFSNRVPVLAPRLRLAGVEKTEVGLVIRIRARHYFDIRSVCASAVFLGEISVPRVAKIVVAPGPLLFTGGNVMTGDMNNPTFRNVIVTAKEIFFASDAHVAARSRNVGVPGEVVGRVVACCVLCVACYVLRTMRRNKLSRQLGCRDSAVPAFAIVHTVIEALCQRKFAYGTAGMVRYMRNIRRKKALVAFMNPRSHVGPPEECLDERGSVVSPH